MGALVSPDADEMEDEREDLDESETIDSGDDMEETELASDERRDTYDCGEAVAHRSVIWVLDWAMA